MLRRHKSESWVEVARRFVGTAASSGYQAEREALEAAIGTTSVSLEIKRIGHADMESARFITDWWVLLVQAEGDAAAENDGPVPNDIR